MKAFKSLSHRRKKLKDRSDVNVIQKLSRKFAFKLLFMVFLALSSCYYLKFISSIFY